MTIALILLALFGAFLAYVATLPADFKITRAAQINAPADVIFPRINNLRAWADWSPWQKMEPSQTVTFSGAEAGVGAAMAWAGKKTGVGRMEITQSSAPTTIGLRLNFEKPMRAENQTVFTLTPQNDGTHVEWTMTGRNNYFGKIFALLFNMDKMVGRDFEKGLAGIKELAEGGS